MRHRARGHHGAGGCKSLCLDTHPGFVLRPWAAAATGLRGWRAAQGSADAAPPHSPPAQLPISGESRLLGARHRAYGETVAVRWQWQDELVGGIWLGEGTGTLKSFFSNPRRLMPSTFQPSSTLRGKAFLGPRPNFRPTMNILTLQLKKSYAISMPHSIPTAYLVPGIDQVVSRDISYIYNDFKDKLTNVWVVGKEPPNAAPTGREQMPRSLLPGCSAGEEGFSLRPSSPSSS